MVERARAAAEERLSGFPRRLAHVRAVASTAERLVASLDLGSEGSDAVVTAAWLHDIGYAESVRTKGFHPVDGAAFAREHGFPAVVVSLIAYHTGAVFEAQQRGLSNLMDEFDEPAGLLLDVLTCADMKTGPDGSAVTGQDRIAEILSRYGPDDPVHRAIERSAPTLLAAVARVDALRSE